MVPRSIALVLGLAVIVSACGTNDESGNPDLAVQSGVDSSTEAPVAGSTEAPNPTGAPEVSVAPAPEPDDGEVTSTGSATTPPDEEDPMNEDPADQSTPAEPPQPEPAAIDSSLAALISAAIADLSAERSIAESDLTVVKAELVVWPNSALGCPHPDMRYKQVPEDGALIVLQAGGVTYNYHSGGTRGLFLCDQPTKSTTPTPTLDLGPDD